MIIVCILCFIVVIIILLLLFIKPKESYIDWDDYKNVKKNWIDNLFDETYVITIPKRKNYVNKIMKTMKIKPVVFKAFEQDKLDSVKEDIKAGVDVGEPMQITTNLRNIGFLRQYLNEDRKCEPCISNDDIIYWLSL